MIETVHAGCVYCERTLNFCYVTKPKQVIVWSVL
jgi:hypothetical protein